MIKLAKIFLLPQFSWSQSVWWLYIQSVYWCYCHVGTVDAIVMLAQYVLSLCVCLAQI